MSSACRKPSVRTTFFPFEPFHALGYRHVEIQRPEGLSRRRHDLAPADRGRRTASLLRHTPTAGTSRCDFEAGGRSILIHNFYVPAGGDEPDPDDQSEISPQARFRRRDECDPRRTATTASGSILVGDLNIAPLEHDVWSHKQLLKVVSHTPVETEGFEAMRKAGGWVDLMRHNVPPEQKIYTWWSYRAPDWVASDRGRRLDHIWSSDNLVPSLTGIDILRDARGWERPSDHVPVIARFDLD